MRARIALHLKSISYEFLQETFGSKSELLLKSNPVHEKMPVLIHSDKPVCESNIIVQYIDDAWSSSQSSGPSILPSHPNDRVLSRFWAAYIDDKEWKWFISLRSILTVQGEEEKKAAIAQVEEKTELLEKAYIDCSKGKPFFNGDHIGYLDINLGHDRFYRTALPIWLEKESWFHQEIYDWHPTRHLQLIRSLVTISSHSSA